MIALPAGLGLHTPITAATTYRYARFEITANGGNATWLYLWELAIYVGATKYPTVTITGDTNPPPYVISSNGYYDASSRPYLVFNNTNTVAQHWTSPLGQTTGYVQIDFGTGNGIPLPTSFAVTADGTGASGTNRYPKNYQLKVSNDPNFITGVVSSTAVVNASFGSLTTNTHSF
ncbi:MAG: hypothetical protein FD167_5968 [bacterium]|nr:MAG: hypothetical protein FD167_5968 [bacterium]